MLTYGTGAHSLGDAHTVHIMGWGISENFVIEPVHYSPYHVRLFAPQLHPDEIWTFSGVMNGVLTGFSSLLGSKELIRQRPPEGMPLIIRLPEKRVKTLKIIVE